MNDCLPKALVESDDFHALNASQVANIRARFARVEEIVSESEDWLRRREIESLGSFLESLELQLSVVQGLPGNDKTEQSNWLVHWSWGFNTSPARMYETLPANVRADLERSPPGCNATPPEVIAWLSDQVVALKRALSLLSQAISFDMALAAHIVVDILLTATLAGVYKTHLNPQLLTQASAES